MFERAFSCTLVLIALAFITSCGPASNMSVKPTALGTMNEITVIADETVWSGIVGTSIDELLGGAYPITPRPEPLYDLRQYTVNQINEEPLRRQLRTYLVIGNINDQNSPSAQLIRDDIGQERVNKALTDSTFRTSIGREKWAYGQLVIYLFGDSDEDIVRALKENYNGISSKIAEHDAKQLYQYTYAKGINKGLSKSFVERYGVTIEIPASFKIAMDSLTEDKLIWLRKDLPSGVVNLVFRLYNYTSEKQVSDEYIRERFDSFGRKFVSSEAANSYMVSNPVDLPILPFNRTIDNRYTKEIRGIWEMENDFLGGPFQSYAIVNESIGKLLIIDGFIYAPGVKKRNMMQEIDLIVNSIRW